MPTPDQLYDEAIDLRDRGEKEQAIAKLDEAVALDPNFAIGHGMLAKLHADLAQADDAIEHALKVVALEPKDTFSYTALSVIYQRCGRIREAEEAKAKAFAVQNGWED
jgi:Flp pilus assembly protein TadD